MALDLRCPVRLRSVHVRKLLSNIFMKCDTILHQILIHYFGSREKMLVLCVNDSVVEMSGFDGLNPQSELFVGWVEYLLIQLVRH